MFEAIQSFVKLTDIVWKMRVNEAWGLGHKHLFRESAMKQGIVDIKLMNWPILS